MQDSSANVHDNSYHTLNIHRHSLTSTDIPQYTSHVSTWQCCTLLTDDSGEQRINCLTRLFATILRHFIKKGFRSLNISFYFSGTNKCYLQVHLLKEMQKEQITVTFQTFNALMRSFKKKISCEFYITKIRSVFNVWQREAISISYSANTEINQQENIY